jgi:hypothetical protein
MWEALEGKSVIGAARVQPRSRERPRGKCVGDKENDLTGLLNDPHSDVQKSQARENQQTGERNELVANFH